MSTTEIKTQISKMNSEERDDIMLYILSLRQEDEGSKLPQIWIKELDRRKAAYDSGRMSGRPLNDLLSELGIT